MTRITDVRPVANGSGNDGNDGEITPAPPPASRPSEPRTLASLADKRAARALHDRTGASIREHKRDVGWTAARSLRGRVASSLLQGVGLRSGPQQMNRFISRVVVEPDPNREIHPDPIDARHQVYCVPLGGKRARLSVDDGGRHVNAFPNELARHPLLDAAVRELARLGWTLDYGATNAVSLADRTLTIDPASTDARVPGVLDIVKRLPLAATGTGATAKYLLDNVKEPKATVLKMKMEGDLAGHGFDAKDPHGTFHRAALSKAGRLLALGRLPPGVGAQDAALVIAYRAMYLHVNAALRDTSAAGAHALVDSGMAMFTAAVNAALEKFPSFRGTCHRVVYELSNADIDRYVDHVGEVVQEPAFVSASSAQDGFSATGDVTFSIRSETGKLLGDGLSPYSEVLFAAGLRYRVDAASYVAGTRGSASPKAVIRLTQLASGD
jgi:hypothetical protein